MRNSYPSDITREQFKKIQSLLENARKRTAPRKIDLYDAFCGVLYILKTGCQWRALPHEYPKWRTVHSYFEIWTTKKNGRTTILDQVLKKISWRGALVPWSQREYKYGHS